MTIPSQPKSSCMPLQESLAFHQQTATIVACNFKIDVSAFFISPIRLSLAEPHFPFLFPIVVQSERFISFRK